MSGIGFQRLQGDKTVDGQILLELQKLNAKGNKTDLYLYAKELFPRYELNLIQQNWSFKDDESNPIVIDGRGHHALGGVYFGYFSLSILGGSDGYVGLSKRNGAELLYFKQSDETVHSMLTTATHAFIRRTENLLVNFIGYKLETLLPVVYDAKITLIGDSEFEVTASLKKDGSDPLNKGYNDVATSDGTKYYISAPRGVVIKNLVSGVWQNIGYNENPLDNHELTIQPNSEYEIELIPYFILSHDEGIYVGETRGDTATHYPNASPDSKTFFLVNDYYKDYFYAHRYFQAIGKFWLMSGSSVVSESVPANVGDWQKALYDPKLYDNLKLVREINT